MPDTYIKFDGVDGESTTSDGTSREADTLPVEHFSFNYEEVHTTSDGSVLVTSYSYLGTGAGDPIPADSFSLNFEKIETYPPRAEDDVVVDGHIITADNFDAGF